MVHVVADSGKNKTAGATAAAETSLSPPKCLEGMNMRLRLAPVFVLCGAVLAASLIATPAAAYIGPGLGLGVIASIFGAIAAFFMMIAGLIWYPVKSMLRKRREKKAGGATPAAETTVMTAETKQPDAPAN